MVKSSASVRILLILLVITALSLLYFFYPASAYHFYPACPFHALTGWFCPGCGSQRAISYLLRGELLQAAKMNVLLVICVPFLLYAAGIFFWNHFSTRKLRPSLFYSVIFTRILLGMVIVFAVLRNIDVYPFNWLAP